MKSWLRVCGLLAIFMQPTGIKGQLIKYYPCESEIVTPNLTIAKPVKLTGSLSTRTGQPIHLNMITIDVRKPWKNKVLFSAVLDEQGRFDLGTVPAGKYRLVTFWMDGKRVRRLPLFDQPKSMSCSSEDVCNLEIALDLHGTDQPFEFCPPK
ncbi:MAG: hypothetical protein ACLP7O_12425 [Terracidiphilus sp.]